MRYNEFAPNHLDETFPGWAKKSALAVGGAAALAGGAHMINKAMAPSGPVTTFELPPIQQTQEEKANPSVVKQMMSLLKTGPGSALTKEARAAGMRGRELAQFLAQCAHESINFSALKELGGTLDFKKYDIKHNPAKAKLLGNIHPGDGLKYIGRGFIQLTGRDNYKHAGHALGLPLEQHPEMVEKPEIAAKVAIWFWKHRVHPKVHDYSDTKAATKHINAGLAKLEDRNEKYKAVAQIIGVLNWPKNKA